MDEESHPAETTHVEHARFRLMLPAIGLIVHAAWILSRVSDLAQLDLLRGQPDGTNTADVVQPVAVMAITLSQIVAVVCASRLLSVRQYRVADRTALFLCIPCFSGLGCIFAIWALKRLHERDVKNAFPD